MQHRPNISAIALIDDRQYKNTSVSELINTVLDKLVSCSELNLDFLATGGSGGSEAAVSAGLVPMALGTDTGVSNIIVWRLWLPVAR